MAPREGISPPQKQKFAEEVSSELEVEIGVIDNMFFVDEESLDDEEEDSYEESFFGMYDSPDSIEDLIETGSSDSDEGMWYRYVPTLDMMFLALAHAVLLHYAMAAMIVRVGGSRGVVLHAYHRMVRARNDLVTRMQRDQPGYAIEDNLVPPEDGAVLIDEEAQFRVQKGNFYEILSDYFRQFLDDPFAYSAEPFPTYLENQPILQVLEQSATSSSNQMVNNGYVDPELD